MTCAVNWDREQRMQVYFLRYERPPLASRRRVAAPLPVVRGGAFGFRPAAGEPLRPPRFITIQVYPKDVGGLLRARSVSSSGDPPAALRPNGERS